MSFYCETNVKKGRKAKWCGLCEGVIPIGAPSVTVPNLDTGCSTHFHPDCHAWVTSKQVTNIEEFHRCQETLTQEFENEKKLKQQLP